MHMFWGLVLEPAKKYSQRVQQSFHLSQAALELWDGENEPVQLVLEFEGSSYILGTLSKKSCHYQIPLDLNFNAGDNISFRTIGRGRIHLTGYHLEPDRAPKVEGGKELTKKKKATSTEFLLQGKRRHAEIIRVKGLKKIKLGAAKKLAQSGGDDSADDSDEGGPVVVVPGSDDEVTAGAAGREAEAVETDEGKKKEPAARKSGIAVALKSTPKAKKLSSGAKQIFTPRPFPIRPGFSPQPIFISQQGFASRPLIMARPMSKTTRKDSPSAKRSLKSDKKNLKGVEKCSSTLRRQSSK